MTRPSAPWAAMQRDDLPAISVLSDSVHGDYSEDIAIYAERLALYPSGCLTLWLGDWTAGYLISHPWHRDKPPALNQAIGAIPATADTYYLHDIALLPDARGRGAGRAATDLVCGFARQAGFQDVTLMAINGADQFWASVGFARVNAADMTAQPSSYGAGAYLMRRAIAD